jgi:hypothetical protein
MMMIVHKIYWRRMKNEDWRMKNEENYPEDLLKKKDEWWMMKDKWRRFSIWFIEEEFTKLSIRFIEDERWMMNDER